jgi:3-oxoacyl-[acyl-carrier protein] reductase
VDLGLSGKVALVTGASSGIGAATARLLACEGVDVVVSYSSNAHGAEQTAAEIRSAGRNAHLLQMDVADSAAVNRVIATMHEHVPVLDIAILCAGTNVIGPFEAVSPAEWDDVIRVNLNGTFYVLQAVQPLLPEGGSIVTVASVAANTGAAHHPHYAAAKAGVVNLTKSAARAFSPRVRINCISPGLTDTAMGDDTLAALEPGYAEAKLLARRIARPEEIARAIVFLASPAASFIYGATLDVNGGRDLR